MTRQQFPLSTVPDLFVAPGQRPHVFSQYVTPRRQYASACETRVRPFDRDNEPSRVAKQLSWSGLSNTEAPICHFGVLFVNEGVCAEAVRRRPNINREIFKQCLKNRNYPSSRFSFIPALNLKPRNTSTD